MEKIVPTKYGFVEGIIHENYYEYRGIPFAKPPVGTLRWHAPEECEPWEGIYKAVQFKAKAVQNDNSGMPLYGKEFYEAEEYKRVSSEDCLYLNVWAPKDAEPAQCPVAVWIHGGAFHHGYSSEMEFDGEEYCKRGVILVTIAYRLGVFGFLSVPELVRRDGYSGNYGLLDQIMALRWVKENIANFGGDPNNITVFGQSAGAMSVLCLCNSKLAEGLFHKAIMQSGAGYHMQLNISQKQEKLHQIYYDLKKGLGVDSFEQMKELDVNDIYQAYARPEAVSKGQFLTPCIDGYVLEKGLDQSMEDGDMFDIPYLIGANKDDMLTEEGHSDEPSGGLWEGAVRLAELLREKGRKVPYLYYFKHDLPGDHAGAFHSAELWYMFGTLRRCWRPMGKADEDLAGKMLDYWCSFIKTGNPNDGFGEQNEGRWNPFGEGSYQIFR